MDSRDTAGLGPSVADSAVWHRQVDRRLDRVQRHLGLGDEERRAFADVHRANASRVWQTARKLGDRRDRLRAVMLSETRSHPRIRQALVEMTAAQAGFDSVVAEAILSELDALPADRQGPYLDMLPWQRWDSRGAAGGGHRRGRHGGRAPYPW